MSILYLKLLLEQFNNSRGYGKEYTDSKQYYEEFINWLYELNKQKKKYVEYSDSLGVDLFNPYYFEINKGKLDTILCSERIISPFGYTMKQSNKTFIEYYGQPYIVSGSDINNGQAHSMYFTFNPYNNYYFGELDKIHNSGHGVCFGMYGKNSDNDKKIKLQFISDKLKNMNNRYVYEYDTDGENYYCIVFTREKIKIKILER